MTTIYDFTVKDNQGNDLSLNKYKGKVLLIVNTATECGFTPQYQGLEELYKKYKDQGFEILDFPSNQFGGQAPGTDAEIQNFCTARFGTTFDRFAKIDVNGENEDPLYTYLKKSQGGLLGDKIKWNFTKFLIDRNGNVVERFSSQKKPENISKEIEKLLEK
ncbi:glutathione peroxidase [Anaerococcus sp. mt242]|uniref:glutathione peroxidase n=1 Tax=Anaerococcus sp. mt242 TaxID=2661917 RepID=UPI00193199AF|nr:glutathione peroxidase [Anaerococcus sp. mt242]MBM0046485.1 glutathione peroxidase [Anaerococcus sp. mt242]